MKREMEKNARRLAVLNRASAKWTAVVTALAVSVCMTGYGIENVKNHGEMEVVKAAENEKDTEETKAFEQVSNTEKMATQQEETVYGFLKADGSVDHVLVSNWLRNFEQLSSVNVSSELKDITNVNGKESFTENADGTITWAADGKDIYYQGSTSKDLPVSVKITYYLDDQEIAPEELAGKSGKVRIRYEYENTTKNMVTIDGTQEELATPFAVITGMILPTEHFSNISTKNAEVISDGSSQIVVGYAFPGLQKSLGITDEDLEEMSEKLTIPDFMEVTADVEDFSLGMTLTMMTSELFSDGDEDITAMLDSLDELKDDMKELEDGSQKLVDGTKELYDGTGDLHDGAKDLDDGAKDLKDGVSQLKDGAKTLYDGTDDLISGAKELTDGAKELKTGAAQLKDGAKELTDGTKSLKNGLDTLDKKSTEVTTGIASLKKGVTQYTDGVSQLKDGADTLQSAYEGETGALAGAKALAEGTNTLYETVSSFSLDTDSLNIDIDLDLSQMIDTTKVQQECTKAAQAYLTEQGIDPATAEGQAIIKAFTAGSTAGTQAVSSAVTQAISSQKEAMTDQISSQIKQQVGTALTSVIEQIKTAAGQLSEGAAALSAGVEQLYGGTKQLSAGIASLDENSTALKDGTKSLKSGWSQYAEGVSSAAQGAKTLYTGSKTLFHGTEDLFDGTNALYQGVQTLDDGAGAFQDGVGELFQGTKDLLDGTHSLKDGTTSFLDGTKELKDGAKELKDGMKELDEEGIQKLTDLFGSDMQTYADRMRSMLDAAKEYDSFSGSTQDIENSVKFILKTAEISNEEE